MEVTEKQVESTPNKDVLDTFGSLLEEAHGYKLTIYTKEKYIQRKGLFRKRKKTILVLYTYAKCEVWKEDKLIDTTELELEVPDYITENQLWHLTDLQLKEIEELSKSMGYDTPNEIVVKEWYVLESNRNNGKET